MVVTLLTLNACYMHISCFSASYWCIWYSSKQGVVLLLMMVVVVGLKQQRMATFLYEYSRYLVIQNKWQVMTFIKYASWSDKGTDGRANCWVLSMAG